MEIPQNPILAYTKGFVDGYTAKLNPEKLVHSPQITTNTPFTLYLKLQNKLERVLIIDNPEEIDERENIKYLISDSPLATLFFGKKKGDTVDFVDDGELCETKIVAIYTKLPIAKAA